MATQGAESVKHHLITRVGDKQQQVARLCVQAAPNALFFLWSEIFFIAGAFSIGEETGESESFGTIGFDKVG